MPAQIIERRSARQRALAGYDTVAPTEPVGAYEPEQASRMGVTRAWKNSTELVEILEVRTPSGRRYEAIVTTDAGTRVLDESDEPGAELTAKRYMRQNSANIDANGV